jgi:hypothetical protein
MQAFRLAAAFAGGRWVAHLLAHSPWLHVGEYTGKQVKMLSRIYHFLGADCQIAPVARCRRA